MNDFFPIAISTFPCVMTNKHVILSRCGRYGPENENRFPFINFSRFLKTSTYKFMGHGRRETTSFTLKKGRNANEKLRTSEFIYISLLNHAINFLCSCPCFSPISLLCWLVFVGLISFHFGFYFW